MSSHQLADLEPTEDLGLATHVLVTKNLCGGLDLTEGELYVLGRWESSISSIGEGELFIVNDAGFESSSFMMCSRKVFYRIK
ncbi:hypothetical protein A7312_27915 [Paenibacillus polymyxa]|uniref:Uncharacterized protein n=1 Tax=Paenibacillus polymyxa TaxID=1406 RepID=A0ABX2ZAA3_PAEPO|nr:hypothetical protein A7312_27915 [Paenibacillus polymyxa]